MESILIIILLLLATFIFVLYSSFSWGYVATVISKWFIIPLFPDFPIFTWIQFAGIMFFINCFVHGSSICNNLKEEYENKTVTYIYILLSPWLTLFGAWVVYSVYY